MNSRGQQQDSNISGKGRKQYGGNDQFKTSNDIFGGNSYDNGSKYQ